MPEVNINSPANRATDKGGGIGGITGLPTPVLLALVGGAIGLVVLLKRSATQPQSDAEASQNGTLLPNTAIMLGSLQQQLQEVMGKVTTGNADLNTTLLGVGNDLSSQIDTQTGQLEGNFTDLNSYLSGQFASVAGQGDSLASLITSLGTQNQSTVSSLQQQLNTKFSELGVSNTEFAKGISDSLNTLYQQQNAETSLLTALGQHVAPTQQAMDLSALNDTYVWSGTDNAFYYVTKGKVLTAGSNYWWKVQNNPAGFNHFNTSLSLRPFVSGALP